MKYNFNETLEKIYSFRLYAPFSMCVICVVSCASLMDRKQRMSQFYML
jgi:hypothetical protein